MVPEENIEEINNRIEKLKQEKEQMKNNIKTNKAKERKELRIKKNGNGKANKLIRVSHSFANAITNINNKREEKGFDELSGPKITDLITRHQKNWKKIEGDIINFNTLIDPESKEEDFADEKQ